MAEDKKPNHVNGNGDKNKVTLTGAELLRLIIFFPVVVTWLVLACRIIWSATSSKETLDSIEGLLTALAVLTIPVSAGLQKLFEDRKE
tara:strand:+ start:60 stop:323 length:264 start_codon:yes stop_codon:yes gene_type:complete